MFGIGMPEVIVLLAIVIIVFVVNKIPRVMEGMEKGIRSFSLLPFPPLSPAQSWLLFARSMMGTLSLLPSTSAHPSCFNLIQNYGAACHK